MGIVARLFWVLVLVDRDGNAEVVDEMVTNCQLEGRK